MRQSDNNPAVNDIDTRVRESVRVNSPHQIEFKERVAFPESADSVRYETETYIFLPPALQVTPEHFTSATLLRSLKNYIRLRAPKLPLTAFEDNAGPFADLDSALKDINVRTVNADEDYENAVRRFALTYRQSVKSALETLAQDPDSCTTEDVRRIIGQITGILAAYRSRQTYLVTLGRELGNNHAWAYCDEFMSIITAYYLRNVYLALDFEKQEIVLTLWESEKQYRLKHYPLSVPGAGADNETLLFRWSVLKKYVSSLLFLEAKVQGGQPMLLHSLYGVAAAVSMLFATIIAFSWQGTYGSLSMNLFWAMVIAYIFKDRIKESLRAWLYKRFQKWIPDRRLQLERGSYRHAGQVEESFRFINAEQVPEAVRKLRESAHTIELLSGKLPEDILLYKKEVTLEKLRTLTQDTGNSVLDIMRLNTRDFLRYTETLFEELPVLEEDAAETAARQAFGEKIYHIYVAQRIKIGEKRAVAMQRLVINAQGIKRLETVQPLTTQNED